MSNVSLSNVSSTNESYFTYFRKPNFPSEISENIVKFFKTSQTGICGNWDCDVGDLNILNKRCEIKAFSSSGPASFGPTEKWDWLYFVDCRDSDNNIFKIYEIKLSNNSEIWQAIMVNSTTTFRDQALQGRRPRILFSSVQQQLGPHCIMVFDGHIDELS